MDADRNPQPLPEEEQPLDARGMAELMSAQRTTVQRSQSRGVRIILVGWALAWIVGFLALWSGEDGGNPLFTLSAGLEWWLFGAAIALGIAVSTVTGMRMGRGVQGSSTTAGKLYGLASAAAFVAMWLFLSALRAHVEIDAATAALLYVGAFVLIAGVIYMVGSAMTRSYAQFYFGLAIAVLAIVATLVGAPHHLLLYAIMGGGLMLAFAWMLGRSIASSPRA
ncbi:hypothetical protein SAMN04487783_1501 [Agrococcus baldri]|uniref:Uncharacterized protein n=1 Tax=Agrococcus baldri TaxID=153730 RepID=A0AA94HND4_9MICO|nr:hypothetical protein [Agrococcus baldri]SFS11024.1 hypothetical protein SAMN04487783_1501 [Agrococcus baldri]